jgi:hypothetical protein
MNADSSASLRNDNQKGKDKPKNAKGLKTKRIEGKKSPAGSPGFNLFR